MPRAHFSVGLHVRRSRSRGQTTDHRHGDERQRHSRYGARAPGESHHRHQRTQKKEPELQPVNHAVLAVLHPEHVEVEIWRADELEVRRGLTSELDEMWSYVHSKANPRGLWHAIDHHTGKVLAYVFGRRQDDVFLQLRQLLAPFGITKFYTDGWGLTSGISMLSNIRWARRTRRKSRANTSISGPGSSASYAVHCASPRRSTCTIS